jgi:hypothetical protein
LQETGKSEEELIQVIANGFNGNRGTWVCKEIAMDLARWCFPAFAVQVMKWTIAILEGDLAGVISDTLRNYNAINNTESEVTVTSRKRKETLELEETEIKITKLQEERFIIQSRFLSAQRTALKEINSWTDHNELQYADQLQLINPFRVASFHNAPQAFQATIKSHQSLSISSVAIDMKEKLIHRTGKPEYNEYKIAGKYATEAYRRKYKGQSIPKHNQDVGQQVLQVNTYMEKDRNIFEEAIHRVIRERKY